MPDTALVALALAIATVVMLFAWRWAHRGSHRQAHRAARTRIAPHRNTSAIDPALLADPCFVDGRMALSIFLILRAQRQAGGALGHEPRLPAPTVDGRAHRTSGLSS